MYQRFYGLTQKPFHATPDPDFLYLSPSHKQALGTIIYGIEQRKGITTVLGEVGLGKTTILRSALIRMDTEHSRIIYHLNPYLSFRSFLEALLQEFDQKPDDQQDEAKLVSQLYHVLIDEYGKGKSVVLCIDEAQNIPIPTMEGLCVLSNLETEKDKLIQIVLVGQPELNQVLARYELRKLDQRISLRTTILPLTARESYDYIQHRLDLAGAKKGAVFTKGALSKIVRYSKGNPRQINRICDNALVTGVGYNRNPVTAKIVKEVIGDLTARTSHSLWKLVPLAASVLILILGLVVLMSLTRSQFSDTATLLEPGEVMKSRDSRGQDILNAGNDPISSDQKDSTLVERTQDLLTMSVPEVLPNVRTLASVVNESNVTHSYVEKDSTIQRHENVSRGKKAMGDGKTSIPAVLNELNDIGILKMTTQSKPIHSQTGSHLHEESEGIVTHGRNLRPNEKTRLAQDKLQTVPSDPINRTISQINSGKIKKSAMQSGVKVTAGKKNPPDQRVIGTITTQKKVWPLQKLPSKQPDRVASPSPITKIMEKGDTLARLMKEVYGLADPATLHFVLKHNSHIVNVRKILPGQQIVFPPLNTGQDKQKTMNDTRVLVSHTGGKLKSSKQIFTESSARRDPNQKNEGMKPQTPYAMVIVQEGDTLEKLSKVVYGSSNPLYIQRVMNYNPQIRHSTKIFAGQEILFPRLPEDIKVFQNESSQGNYSSE